MFRGILKGLLLVSLVISSMVLTYKIWNFRPDLADITTEPGNKQTTISSTSVEDIKTVFLPYQLITNKGNSAKGTSDKDILSSVVRRFSGIKIKEVTESENGQLMMNKVGNHFTILDFTDELPSSLYLSDILNNASKEESKLQFSRILIDSDTDKHLIIYLLSNDNAAVRLKTNSDSKKFNQRLANHRKSMESYTSVITNAYTTDEKTSLYVPTHPKHKEGFSYLADPININEINKVLLGDSDSIIERTNKDKSRTYNSNTGIVKTNGAGLYQFNNISEAEEIKSRPEDNILNSYIFVTKHGGFTDDYRYFRIDDHDNSIDYQMYLKGHPVFSDKHLSDINIIWGNKNIYEYRRGLYSSSIAVPSVKKVKKLPDAEEVRYQLAAHKDYQFENVNNMMIGYYMEKSEDEEIQQATLSFRPAWFIQYKGKWMRYDDGRLV